MASPLAAESERGAEQGAEADVSAAGALGAQRGDRRVPGVLGLAVERVGRAVRRHEDGDAGRPAFDRAVVDRERPQVGEVRLADLLPAARGARQRHRAPVGRVAPAGARAAAHQQGRDEEAGEDAAAPACCALSPHARYVARGRAAVQAAEPSSWSSAAYPSSRVGGTRVPSAGGRALTTRYRVPAASADALTTTASGGAGAPGGSR